MRTFSFRPALTLRGRKFKGLRGATWVVSALR